MAEPKPMPACANCDRICEENPYNADGECWGKMTRLQRIRVGLALMAESLAIKLGIDTNPTGDDTIKPRHL